MYVLVLVYDLVYCNVMYDVCCSMYVYTYICTRPSKFQVPRKVCKYVCMYFIRFRSWFWVINTCSLFPHFPQVSFDFDLCSICHSVFVDRPPNLRSKKSKGPSFSSSSIERRRLLSTSPILPNSKSKNFCISSSRYPFRSSKRTL